MNTINVLQTKIESGQLRLGPNGEPFITAQIINETDNKSEMLEFLIDTGFNGFLQLDKGTISRLSLQIVSKGKVRGFDNVEKEIDFVTSKIKILGLEGNNVPVHVVENGALLLGTMFLKKSNISLLIDYRNGKVFFNNEENAQRKILNSLIKIF